MYRNVSRTALIIISEHRLLLEAAGRLYLARGCPYDTIILDQIFAGNYFF
jgi:hypothetical protein